RGAPYPTLAVVQDFARGVCTSWRTPGYDGLARAEGVGMVEATQSFSSELGQLAAMRAFLDTACRRAWAVEADDEALCQLELATHEAATNIIRHAYAGQAGRPITMTVTADAEKACVTLRHEAGLFDPRGVAPPRFDGSRFGGFGVYLIQQLV